MTFINALINVPADIDMRIAIRNEFLRLGIKELIDVCFSWVGLFSGVWLIFIVFKSLKAKCDVRTDIELITQIDVFEEESALDYKDIHDRFATLDVDVKYPLKKIPRKFQKNLKKKYFSSFIFLNFWWIFSEFSYIFFFNFGKVMFMIYLIN